MNVSIKVALGLESLFGRLDVNNGFINGIDPAAIISFVQQKEKLIKLRLVALYLKDYPVIANSVICRPAGQYLLSLRISNKSSGSRSAVLFL